MMWDRKAGMARIAASDAAVLAVKRAAAVPAGASAEIPVAPARRVVLAPQDETVMTANGPRPRRVTRDGFHPVTTMDAFDRMALQARRRGGDAGLTVAQVATGRDYAALSERCACEGVRGTLSSVLPSGGRGGASRDWMDGVIARSRRLAQLRAAIPRADVLSLATDGAGCAHGGRRLRVVDVVDGVCLHGRTLSEVLDAFGWPRATRYRVRLREALAAALDAMAEA